MIGKLLGNRYEIQEQLGGGGMAVVYKAKDTFLNRLVTIKVLRSEFVSDSDFIRRFRREAQAVASLSHSNIVNIHDVGQEEDTHYLVMEYIDGDNLKNFIQDKPDLPIHEIVSIVRQICDALQHAHENNIVHRDVKPHNILITPNHRVKLTDFGIALEATTGTITNTQTIMGSVHYISPEQAKGETPGPQSDIYSLGVVLYEMLTSQLPFKGDGPVAVALKHIQEQPPLPGEINPHIPKELERVVLKAMEKNPDQRYRSAQEFSSELLRAVNGQRAVPDQEDDFATQVLPSNIKAEQEEIKSKKEDKKAKAIKISVLAGLLLLSLLGGMLFALFNYLNVPEVAVPEVEGLPVEEARILLAGEGLEPTEREIHSSSVEKGIVISQSIAPGTKVKKGRAIEMTVSLGPEMQTLPDVTNLPISDARIMLHNADFNYKENEVFDENVEAGYVISQDPPHGKHPKGITVELKVSKGPEFNFQSVPNLIGLNIDAARARLAEYNLVLAQPVKGERSDRYLEGQVIRQTPESGTEIREGSEVSIVVSEGPGPAKRTVNVTVPIDDDGKSHEVRISVEDVRGTRDVYVATRSSGEIVVEPVEYYGNAVIRVYIDGELKFDQSP
ncbi:Stk1 family PASTA domain-containing Ser/Thr kinase [Desulfofalx alkaliphila]|uniref:Stk1 family PASTA domain-containing Ser/Thr kinase n=1 Tax=Desulfofalx alkaliphila TaxID=105483 RepID=UPI0004E24E5A|nr:Stk1 family PASTA domain-containing Ser/Thr kinase [Desulfofalx alkaliphila]